MFKLILKKVFTFFKDIEDYFRLLKGLIFNLPNLFRDRKLIFDQMVHIGVNSLVLISIIGLFTGAVTAWQGAYQMKGFAPLSILGSATPRAIMIELGPVLAAIVLAGRVGASISAEIGTMKVTEQIDALEAMAINPVRYLAMPRVVATTFMLPVLVIYASAIAIFGAYLVSMLFLEVPGGVFINGFRRSFALKDVNAGFIKALFFGFTISSIGCYVGFKTTGGAEGVGNSTIKSFVICAAMILILDAILWNFLIG